MKLLGQHTVSIERQSYINNKSTLISNGEYIGLLKAVNPRYESISPDAVGKAYHFTTEGEVDIKESDILTHNGNKYTVQGVSIMRTLTLIFTRVILMKDV